MKITIDLPDMYVETLGKWASVSRTLKTAASACNEAGLSPDVSETDKEKYNWCDQELNMITRPLDVLHAAVREQIWIQQREQNKNI